MDLSTKFVGNSDTPGSVQILTSAYLLDGVEPKAAREDTQPRETAAAHREREGRATTSQRSFTVR